MDDDEPMEEPDPRYVFLRGVLDGGYAQFEGEWYVRPPGCPFAASISQHEVTQHADGTITVSPSILYQVDHYNYSFHGFLEHGVWRSV